MSKPTKATLRVIPDSTLEKAVASELIEELKTADIETLLNESLVAESGDATYSRKEQ